jgi:hypothetical protein
MPGCIESFMWELMTDSNTDVCRLWAYTVLIPHSYSFMYLELNLGVRPETVSRILCSVTARKTVEMVQTKPNKYVKTLGK